MLQTGRGDRPSIPNTIRLVKEAYETQPRMPVISGEVCYEGIGEACRQEVQRFMFWVCSAVGRLRAHVRSQRHLAGQQEGSALRPVTSRHGLGKHPVGRG